MKSAQTILLAIVSVALVHSYRAQAQTRGAKPLAFEVASIKPNVPDGSGTFRVGIQPQPGGRLTITNASLRLLVRFAYNIDDSQIAGGPPWMDSDRYDIVAKGEGNPSIDQTREMLQTLLAERFDLKVHRESKELPIYALTVGKGGPKVQPTQDQPASEGASPSGPGAIVRATGDGPPRGVRGVVMLRGVTSQMNGTMTMPQLAQALANSLGRKVVDRTGLQGNYDIKLEWAPQPGEGPTFGAVPAGAPGRDERGDHGASAPEPTTTGIFTAIQEQLGLKLDSQKGPVDTIVVDNAAKPKENQ